MSEQTFRSPGFFEREIDLSARQATVTGVPAGVVGTAERGPAFVPVTVGSFVDFENRFGGLNPERFGPYAVNEFLKHRTALTYVRVLGAGANETDEDIRNYNEYGYVKNAGFRVIEDSGKGGVVFISAEHHANSLEASCFPLLTDNQSVTNPSGFINLVRGMLLLASGTDVQLIDYSSNLNAADDSAFTNTDGLFKIKLESDNASYVWGNAEGSAGVKIFTASLDPKSNHYIGKVLNTDPLRFQSEHHLLYADFAFEKEIASTDQVLPQANPPIVGLDPKVYLTKGTSTLTVDQTRSYKEMFGSFDTRYTTPKTTSFISQPFGTQEYDLFHFETISDGVYGNDKIKISIANLRASTDPNNPYGTFEVQVRNYSDVDSSPEILESYPECNLNPNSDSYVAKKIGDYKVYYDFDHVNSKDRQLVVNGRYGNVSPRIRIVMNQAVEEGTVPKNSLPFGFRGLPVLKTSDTLTDDDSTPLVTPEGKQVGDNVNFRTESDGSRCPILPPVPFRFKTTKGKIKPNPSNYLGEPGRNERVDARQYWGVMTKRIPATVDAVQIPNEGSVDNQLVKSYTKFLGIQKLDTLVSGSGADEFNNNKFTLARVAFANQFSTNVTSLKSAVNSIITGSINEHMIGAAYIRSSHPEEYTYAVDDKTSGPNASVMRVTLASLLHGDPIVFNRFTPFAKFTNIFYGGFDGVNMLDRDVAMFKDKSLSTESSFPAAEDQPSNGLLGLGSSNDQNQSGYAQSNNSIYSLNRAVDIITDSLSSNINILTTPGIRNEYVTQHAMERVKNYSLALYLLDLVKYDENGNIIYDDSKTKPDIRVTSDLFEARAIDNNYAATYFPDVLISDPTTGRNVKVPASIAALGTLAFNDKDKAPWYAPAGFNRGGLDFVRNIETRLTTADRDVLYDARINPIASFPNADFVIFGQKTLQQAKTALDRVNVRRLLIEVKRQVASVANGLLFEPNTAATRARFVAAVTPLLAAIQLQAGIEQFRVVMDESNNTQDDIDNHRLNGRIVVVPTRAVEFVAIDFIITNSGVDFS